MHEGPIEIRRLDQDQAAEYRSIRLEALERSPEAFGSTLAAEEAQPLSWFQDRLASSMVFGAFHGPSLLGVAGFAIQQGQKREHKGILWGMYVRPAARSAGVGKLLVEAVCKHARNKVELIQLTVVQDNDAAQFLYAKVGLCVMAWR